MSTLRVDNITDEAGTAAPDFPNGLLLGGAPLGALTQVQAEDPTSTVFGLISGERLAQAVGPQAPGRTAEVFTASGTWTKPAGLPDDTPVYVEAWGGGGGGRSASNNAGGGGGAYAARWFRAGDLGATVTVTIGAGGAAQTAGGNTTFGTFLTAFGGGGHTGGATGAGGGETSAGAGDVPGLPGGGAGTAAFGVGAHALTIYGGGGAGLGAAGGRAVYGGGGGGTTGGISAYGGNGGSSGVAGSAPGGGGGGQAAGARGELRVWI
jgi:hypothetical protein